jgi:membrane-associated phospholipid phosphatase
MLIAYVVFFGGLGVLALVGLLVARRPAHQPPPDVSAGPLSGVRGRLRASLGDQLAAVAIAVPLIAVTFLVMLPVGRLARHYESSVDLPFLRWQFHHWEQFGTWHDINGKVTEIGSLAFIKIVCVVAGIGFALLWRRRRWWIPLLVMPLVFVTDKYTQLHLKELAGRPKPFVSTLGSYPSGGCMRVVTVFGVICYLTLLTWPQISKAWRATGWTIVGVLAFLEAYSRIFVIKHYIFDVVGGLLCGTLLLLSWVSALSCFGTAATQPEGSRQRSHATSVAAEAG